MRIKFSTLTNKTTIEKELEILKKAFKSIVFGEQLEMRKHNQD